ncbi:type 1 glutamine amidotransferase [Bacteriovorax sp. Seq25_V]|uniref:type 1 glutamine amidotransferase n=1 Tax=Bacteriovorax sp. Seq25_V TaxID=1201288 RepID=UPI0018DF2564|nr:gamma-glutamyl-gamma-aminobutyrate hydrolase family protein [Bacteriovorax sp. Seq25_V]
MNKIVQSHGIPFTYHWVSTFGTDSLDFIDEASGYIIFGSDSNVSDRLPWQIDLSKRMKAKIEAGIPVLGICFGHQLMADAYGATIDLVKPDNRCFEGTRKQKVLTDHLGFKTNEELEIFITHHYEVKNLPQEFIHLSTSSDCFYDGLAHKTKPFFSFQGHPEASRHFVENHIESKLPEEQVLSGLSGGNRVISNFIELVRLTSV